MREFESFTDFTGQNRTLKCQYHGVSPLRLEGIILQEEDTTLKVGVTVWAKNIERHTYDEARRSLDLFYQAPTPGVVRICITPLESYIVPKDIKEINVYDVDQEP